MYPEIASTEIGHDPGRIKYRLRTKILDRTYRGQLYRADLYLYKGTVI